MRAPAALAVAVLALVVVMGPGCDGTSTDVGAFVGEWEDTGGDPTYVMRVREPRDGLLKVTYPRFYPSGAEFRFEDGRLTYSPVTPDQVDVIEFRPDSDTISITSGASGVTYTLARPADPASDYEQRADPEPILGVSLPTDMRTLIAVLGPPDEVELPLPLASEPSPRGQWFRWNPGAKYNTVIALGGDYSPTKPNFRAGVGLLAMRANKRGVVTETIHGFELNRTTRGEVEQSLVGLAPSTLAERDLLCEGKYFRSALQFMKHDIYTYFLFDADERLVGVAQAAFYVDGAGN
jgi:hypothetical protein